MGAAGGVLGGAAGNEFGVTLLEVVVEAHVLFLGENGVIGLEAVFLEESFIAV